MADATGAAVDEYPVAGLHPGEFFEGCPRRHADVADGSGDRPRDILGQHGEFRGRDRRILGEGAAGGAVHAGGDDPVTDRKPLNPVADLGDDTGSVAAEPGCAVNTASEHLRKAEAKLVRAGVDVFNFSIR